MANRILKAGWINFKRNSYLSLAAVGIMSLALALLVSLIAFQFLTSEVVTSLESKLDVTAYFKAEAQETEVLSVKSDLEALQIVASVEYISRDQALLNFKEGRKDDADVQGALNQLDENPLFASLNIGATNPSDYGKISEFLAQEKYQPVLRKIVENKEVIDKARSISGALRNWGLATIIVVGVVAVLVTFNTVSLTIYNQKQEIEIMRLVGASNWQIRGPFVVEGGYYGLFSALFTLIIMYPVIYVISDKLSVHISDINIFGYFLNNIFQVVLIVLALGVFMGMASSFIAVKRYLKI